MEWQDRRRPQAVFQPPVPVGPADTRRIMPARRRGDIRRPLDLQRDVGSLRWWKDFAKLAGLTAAAIALWPDLTPVHAAAPLTASDPELREEYRSLVIMPLALGGDNGRRMGPTELVEALPDAPERPTLYRNTVLARGESFTGMLQRAGVGPDEARQAARLVGQHAKLDEIPGGTDIALTLGRLPEGGGTRPLERLDFRARFDLNLSIARSGDGLAVTPRQVRVDTTPLRIRGVVGDSLYRSARAAGAPARAVQAYLRALSSRLDIDADIRPTDHFDLVVDYSRAATGEVKSGNLLYAGLERDGKAAAQLLRWGKQGEFYESGDMRASVRRSGGGPGLVAPVQGRLTSRYGMRMHPILRYRRKHSGVDFGAPTGAPIYAVTDGIVSMSGWGGGCGNVVKLEHGQGMGTRYCHMVRTAVNRGERVRKGQVIGYVGSTGRSTGPHLHYEVYRNGRTIDPLTWKFAAPAVVTVDRSEQKAFQARLDAILKIRPGAALDRMATQPSGRDGEGATRREIDRIALVR